jgi:hypothetical protein
MCLNEVLFFVQEEGGLSQVCAHFRKDVYESVQMLVLRRGRGLKMSFLCVRTI